jgi:hypothetical protein
LRTRFSPNAQAAASENGITQEEGYLSLGCRTSVGAHPLMPLEKSKSRPRTPANYNQIQPPYAITFLPQISRVKIADLGDRQTDYEKSHLRIVRKRTTAGLAP